MTHLQKLSGKGLPLGARGLLAAALTLSALGLAAAPAAAATVVVDTTTDQALGSCAGSCSLRDAVATAGPGDTVQIPAGHYILTLGHISITRDVTLAGAGARTTLIDGDTTSGGGSGGIFYMTGGIRVEIDDLSLIDGVADSAGGAIYAEGRTPEDKVSPIEPITLTVRRCTIARNQAIDEGGGLWITYGNLVVEDSTFSDNRVPNGAGGGVFSDGVTGSIVNSTFSGNSGLIGAGMELVGTTMTLTNNTLTANQGTSVSGLVAFSSRLILSNNVIAGNEGSACLLPGTTVVSNHNLDGDGSCGFTGAGDLAGAGPLLEKPSTDG